MRFYDTHYDEYIKSNEEINLHPKLMQIYKNFPNKLNELKNLIFYGPSGVGKYTQMLLSIKKYSPSNLKYEKKISLLYNKHTYYFKISDIHFEIDMSILGCQSKLLWNEIYNNIVDIILAKNENTGIIVCKYFHDIHSDLLEIFYSYMQTLTNSSIDIKFILLTEELSFIPDNIVNCSYIINVARPSKLLYNNIIKNKINKNKNKNKVTENKVTEITNIKNIKLNEITNIKNIFASIDTLMQPYKLICDNIIEQLIEINNNLQLLNLRDKLYDIFIYNIDVTYCIWYILESLLKKKYLNSEDINSILLKTYICLYYYNNNYRPIYHLERYMLYLIIKIHKY